MFCCVWQVCGGDKPYMSPEQLEREHARVKATSLELFASTRKMGGPEFSESFARSLHDECDELYANFVKHNESKNIFAAARSPAVLFTLMMACYVLSGLLGVFGLETLANLLNMFMGVSLCLLTAWAYIRYSGEYRELGIKIDQCADLVWDMVSTSFLTSRTTVCFMWLCHECCFRILMRTMR